MKKRISLLLTLAMTALITTGCDALDAFSRKGNEAPTEQQQEDNQDQPQNEDEGKQDEGSDKPVKPIVNYNVSFDANGGTGSMEPDVTEESMYYVTRECEFQRENYIFYRWALNSPSGTLYDLGDTIYDIDSDITLYAVWEEDEPQIVNYNVTFKANGGSGTMANQVTNGSTFVVPSCAFTYSNHSFDKWALGSVSGTKYNVGLTIQNISSDIVLYATWIEDTIPVTNYTVTFNANGGTGTMASQQTNGDTFVVPSCSFTKENYDFKNWAYESKNGVEYSPGETIVNIDKNITLYALWQEKQTIDPENPDIPAGYYSQCEGLSGSALQAKLKSINAPVSPSYDWSRYEDADEALDDSNSIFCVYTRHNIPKNNHCGSYSWNTWNREHVWTQSAYPASKTDNHNIFACEGQINNDRGNLPYAEGGSYVTVHGHTTECKSTGSTFEPCDDAKGEIARAVMYGTVMYSYTMTNEIQSIELALKWHLQHPNTERDIRRNNVVYGNQGNRNPFVDHPEYACKIWGTTNSATRSLCGM